MYLSALAESESEVMNIVDWLFDSAPGVAVCTDYLRGYLVFNLIKPMPWQNM